MSMLSFATSAHSISTKFVPDGVFVNRRGRPLYQRTMRLCPKGQYCCATFDVRILVRLFACARKQRGVVGGVVLKR